MKLSELEKTLEEHALTVKNQSLNEQMTRSRLSHHLINQLGFSEVNSFETLWNGDMFRMRAIKRVANKIELSLSLEFTFGHGAGKRFCDVSIEL